MPRFSVAVLSLAALALALVAAEPQRQEAAGKFFDGLQVGESVVLKDLGSVFEITVIPGQKGPLGHTVIEIGSDFVLLRDISGMREIRIPVYSIKSVTTLSVKAKVD